jgi:hypothetical protein
MPIVGLVTGGIDFTKKFVAQMEFYPDLAAQKPLVCKNRLR